MGSTAVQQWLEDFCGDAEGVASGLVLLAGPHDTRPVARWPREIPQGAQLQACAQAALRARLPVIESGSQPAASRTCTVVGLPVGADDGTVGAVAIALQTAIAGGTSATIQALERAIVTLVPPLSSLAADPTMLDAGKVLRLQAAVLSRPRCAEAAAAFATDLATLFGFDRVTVGFVEDGYTTVVAVSHGADVQVQQELNRAVAAAMDEALDQGVALTYPSRLEDKPRVTLAHAELVRRQGGTVCSIPLASLGRLVGALTLERGGAQPITENEIAQYEHVACLVAPILDLKRTAERQLRTRVRETFGKAWAALFGPGHRVTKFAAGALAAATVAALYIPVPYRVSAPARLEGVIQLALVAPLDGFLQEVYVRPGDQVASGQLLAELADQDLELERRKWASELAQHENAYGAALAKADRAQLVINQAKGAEARAQLALVEHQLARTRIQAPFDGVVIKGDLTQSLGAPVQRGEVLLTLAPRDQYRLIVEVDERDIGGVKAGASGQVTLAALPSDSLGFYVERVTPVATTQDGRHFFEVEGKLESAGMPLRPGLEGVAKIEADRRSLAWILTHRLVNWLWLTLWSWGV